MTSPAPTAGPAPPEDEKRAAGIAPQSARAELIDGEPCARRAEGVNGHRAEASREERCVTASALEMMERGDVLPKFLNKIVEAAPDSVRDEALGAILHGARELRHGEHQVCRPALERLAILRRVPGSHFTLYSISVEAVGAELAELDAKTVWEDFSVRRSRALFQGGLDALAEHPDRAQNVLDHVNVELGRLRSEAGGRLPAPLDWATLRAPADQRDNLLGNRFLERGQGFIVFSPPACGKSIAALQAVAGWAIGIEAFHIKPVRPLKTVMVQTEDSINDTREALAGILDTSDFTGDRLRLLEKNLILLPPVAGGDANALAELMNAAAAAHRPDLITLNPLLAFCAGDPARELGGLLYQTVDPILKRWKVALIGVHHTPKMNNKDTSTYGVHDFQYLAAGDARVANWPRAMIQIEPVGHGVYRFRCTKRWQRCGWTWDGKPTAERFFKHSTSAIRWVDAMPEEAAHAAVADDSGRIVTILPGPEGGGISRERIRNLAKSQLGIGKDRADAWLKLAMEDNMVERVEAATNGGRKAAQFRRTR